MQEALKQLSSSNKSFFKDEKTIYYLNKNKPTRIPNVDYQTFKVFSRCLAGDCNAVYAHGTMQEGLQIFDDADMDNVVFIPDDVDGTYFVDNQNLYHYNNHFIEYCNVLDLWESENIIKQYLVQNYPERVAWWNYGLDFYKKLEPISVTHYKSKDKVFYHFRDDKDLYDYPSYQMKVSGFNFDHEGCFICIRDADVATFQVLNEIYSKDKNSVYFHSRRITADVDSFEIIDQLFAKDINGIWYNGRLAEVVENPNTFEVITKNERRCDGHSAKDKVAEYVSKKSRIARKGYALILKKAK